MGSTFDEISVEDFDLNFLQPSGSSNTVNECRIDKQRQSIIKLKRKVISVNFVLNKYHEIKEQFAQSEVLLLAAKEECKQVCIDYKECLEKCANIEKDLKSCREKNKILQMECEMTQNQLKGLESHANQLQVLVTEQETELTSLKIENQLDKTNTTEYEKKLLSLEKENETLLNNLCLARDIAFGKKKLHKHHKELFKQYANVRYSSANDSSAESSSEETDLLDSSPPSPLNACQPKSNNNKEIGIEINNGEIVVLKNDTARNNEDHDSDFSNEIVSEDTGRGSSMTFSDGDKCFSSPDYYINESPFITECNKFKEKRVLIDTCTSPIIFNRVIDIATSPLIFDDEALLSDNYGINSVETSSNTEYIITDIPLSTEIVTIKEKKTLVDIGTSTVDDIIKINVSTSPLPFNCIVSKQLIDSATSPIKKFETKNKNSHNVISPEQNRDIQSIHDAANNSLKKLNDLPTEEKKQVTIKNLSSQCEIEISSKTVKERICLERNNSRNLCDGSTDDGEIEMILNTMRLTDQLITPIPNTPARLSNKHCSSQYKTLAKQLNNISEDHIVCAEALKLREENKLLHTNIADLTKDIMNIKNILKKENLMPESPRSNVSETSNLINAEEGDDYDCSEDMLTIEIEKEQNSVDREIDLLYTAENINNRTSLSSVTENSKFNESLHNNDNYESTIADNNELESLAPLTYSDHQDYAINENNENEVTEICSPAKPCVMVQNNTEATNIINHQESNINESVRDKLVFDAYVGADEMVIDNKNKKVKPKKLSKLDKLRNKLLPKGKIKKIDSPIQKSKFKIKPVLNNKTTEAELLLNNQLAFEKARKVMAELNSKTKEKKESRQVAEMVSDIKYRPKNEFNNNEILVRRQSKGENLHSIECDIREPIVCIPQLNLDLLNKQNIMQLKSPKKSNNILSTRDDLPKRTYVTRSRSQSSNNDSITLIKFDNKKESISESTDNDKAIATRMRLKRVASDSAPTDCKRMLRSQHVKQIFIDHEVKENERNIDPDISITTKSEKIIKEDNKATINEQNNSSECKTSPQENINKSVDLCVNSQPKDSILCKMLLKYGKNKTKFMVKKVSENPSNSICEKLEKNIEKILELPVGDKSKDEMNNLVKEIRQNWNLKHFTTGLIKYLKEPARKRELYNKICSPPAPPMTKSEQVLLFVIRQLEMALPNTVRTVLNQIEYSLFQLNRTPEFDIIESLSHFYALLCRYFGYKNRLRLFILDAMYCLQFKVVPLITQCLDVWMHILPLAHMGVAKSPLVICLVYLLHFYKCEDKFNRIQGIRFTLSNKYFYQITEWNEKKLLEMFKTSIMEVREIKVEKKMLRMAFIILAKRQGPKWCQKNIIKDMLLPIIEGDAPLRIKQFCVELLGPLLKPYPVNMKVHCEIAVNQLLDMLDGTTSDSMKESIFTSLIYMNKHNPGRVTRSLLSWTPKKVSSEFEEIMRDFVREKPIKAWKGILSKIAL